MQTDPTGSHSAVADGNSLQTALFSLGYSDLVDRQFQNHVMAGFPLPPTLGEELISFSRGQMWSRVGDEFWSAEKDTVTDMEGFSTPGASFTSPKTTFEGANYSYEGLPVDASTIWDFNKAALHPEFVGRVVGETADQPIMNEWIFTEQERFSSINPGPSRFNKELSLSLATSHPLHGTSIQEQGSELSSSGVTSYSLHKRHIGSDNTSCSSNNLSLNFNSYKPFPVATQLSGSRFFQAMQEILAEFACYALENCDQMSFSATGSDHRVSFASSCTAGRGGTRNGFSDELDSDHTFLFHSNLSHEKEVESKKKHLLSLLQVVDDQYNQCLDEIHTVISAFHAVTELDPNLHTRFALPTITLMYRNLKERISSHILAMGASHSEGDARENSSFETSFIQKQWALQQLKKRDHQLWRPQRGLPERSVSVLRAWMFQNFLHPYPKDAEKHLLALKSGLTRSQVSNWFINARVRLWKPMIEEMYAEMNRRKARRNEEETNGSHRNHLRFGSRRFAVD